MQEGQNIGCFFRMSKCSFVQVAVKATSFSGDSDGCGSAGHGSHCASVCGNDGGSACSGVRGAHNDGGGHTCHGGGDSSGCASQYKRRALEHKR